MQLIHSTVFRAAAIALAIGAAHAQPALSRRDLQVPNHFGSFLGAGGRVTTGDFNGDGRPDLIVSSLMGLSILLNSGGADFAPARFYPYRACGAITAADFNGDGKLDLFEDESCDFAGRILLGRGDGTFSPPQDLAGCNLAAIGDFNGDGKPDLACNDPTTTSLRVLLGNGDGTFRSGVTVQVGPSQAGQIVTADFNHDGKADIAAKFLDTVAVFLGRGDGTFGQPLQTRLAIFTLIAVADFNGDSVPDLATGSDIYLGKGDGNFQSPQRHFTPSDGLYAHSFASADLNGDGHFDLVTGGFFVYPVSNRILIFLGRGDGTMSPPVEHKVGWGPFYGAVADLDGDGRSDLVTANLASNTVSLLLSKKGDDSRLMRAASSASGVSVVAPGSLATLYVSTGAAAPELAGPAPWPTRLGGISLEIRDSVGSVQLAPLLYISSAQINFLVPVTSALGEATLSIIRGDESAQAGRMQVDAVAPGIFMVNQVTMTAAAVSQRVESDGSQTSRLLFDCSAPDFCIPLPVAPSRGGSFVSLYGTGFRNASVSNVECFINGWRATVEYAGPQGTPGLDQIVIRLPEESDEFWDGVLSTDVVVSISGVLANRTWFTFSR